MLKMEIELDSKIIDKLGYNSEKLFEFLPTLFEKAGFIKEKAENGYFLYRGPGLNTDLAYTGIVANGLVEQDWVKMSCKKWFLLTDRGSKDGSFYIEGDWIESYKKYGRW